MRNCLWKLRLGSEYLSNSCSQNFGSLWIKKFLKRVFIQNDLNFMIPNMRVNYRFTIFRENFTWFNSKYRKKFTESNSLYLSADLTLYFVSKSNLRKNLVLEWFINICVVIARLLITEKSSITFTPVWMNPGGIFNPIGKRLKKIKVSNIWPSAAVLLQDNLWWLRFYCRFKALTTSNGESINKMLQTYLKQDNKIDSIRVSY